MKTCIFPFSLESTIDLELPQEFDPLLLLLAKQKIRGHKFGGSIAFSQVSLNDLGHPRGLNFTIILPFFTHVTL